MQRGGAKNDDVTAFRHALVEFDRDEAGASIPKEAQYSTILASGLPVAVLIDSGNKSLHAWVRVDAPDAAEYKRRVDLIWAAFEGQALDKQNRNLSRLSRCPDGRRTVDGEVRVQKLLAVGFGAVSWDEWEAEHGADALPKIIPGPYGNAMFGAAADYPVCPSPGL
jgi:RecA-family ATPase